MAINELRVMGRATQGVRVIRLDDDDDIADVTVVKPVVGADVEEAGIETGTEPGTETGAEPGTETESEIVES
jgi:DNA gyrase subunit A